MPWWPRAQPRSLFMDEYQTRHLTAWLSYTLTSKINAAARRQLTQQFPDPTALIEAVIGGALPNNIETQRHSSTTQRRIDQALQWLDSGTDRHILTLSDPHYPELLASISSPPPVVYVRGKLEALHAPHVAMVGARKATHPALEIAREISAGLAQAGVAVVSGMALGIDAAAHQGCLHAGGRTVAVAATPIDVVYPKRHQQLAQDIAQDGAIITDFPLTE